MSRMRKELKIEKNQNYIFGIILILAIVFIVGNAIIGVQFGEGIGKGLFSLTALGLALLVIDVILFVFLWQDRETKKAERKKIAKKKRKAEKKVAKAKSKAAKKKRSIAKRTTGIKVRRTKS